MSVTAAKSNEVQGPFPSRPGQLILDEFRSWVEETGQPDLWRFHDPSSPPRDQDFEELIHFSIPTPKRADVDMASCPICSPLSPKYFEGVLAWFPLEGVLRAIGHECAKGHFGATIANAAIAKRRRREAIESAQYFLLDTLPKIEGLRSDVGALEPVARDIDRLRQVFWARSSKAACERLAKLGAKGELTVEEAHEVSAVDIFGKNITQQMSRVIATYSVSGLGFLRSQSSVLARARNTALALGLVRATTPEEALDFVTDELSKDEYLFEAEKLARTAVNEYKRLCDTLDEVLSFLASKNLEALSDWSNDRRSGAPLIVKYNSAYPARLHVRAAGRTGADIPIPKTLLISSPSISPGRPTFFDVV